MFALIATPSTSSILDLARQFPHTGLELLLVVEHLHSQINRYHLFQPMECGTQATCPSGPAKCARPAGHAADRLELSAQTHHLARTEGKQ